MLETATRSKKHETIVEGQRLRKAGHMERECSRFHFPVKISKKATPTYTPHAPYNTTQHREGERETRLFFDSTGGGAGPFSLICLANSVNERDLSLLKSSMSDLYLISTYMYMYMYMYKYMYMYLVIVTHEHQHQDPHIAHQHPHIARQNTNSTHTAPRVRACVLGPER